MTDLETRIYSLASPDLTVAQISQIVGCERTAVYRCIQKYGLIVKQRKKPIPRTDTQTHQILSMNHLGKTSQEIATEIGCSAKHVQNILRINNCIRLKRGALPGELNSSWRGGRIVDNDGYASIPAPPNHPNSRLDGRIAEHRHVMEQYLGRYLDPLEVVDHIDGLHLHNAPSNLRVFAKNADHLRETITGNRPNWSPAGFAKMQIPSHQRKGFPQVDTYRQRKANGDVRLQQILLALLKLGRDSPYLSGTLHHLEQAQIDYSCETKIKQALEMLSPSSF
ncbi:HNH endonuclease [Acinetobacter vivianii]|uniref:HNH endonuclease n=1 Tax=Acinetobacter vivianii TaxID=1776742 RepID=UPI0040424F61